MAPEEPPADPCPTPAKRRIRRWILLLVAAAVVLLVGPPLAVLGIREARVSRLREVVEGREKEGLATTFEDLLAMAPRVDSIEQERFAAALKGIDDLPDEAIPGSEVEGIDDRSLGEWVLGVAASPRDGTREAIERTRAPAVEVTAFARRERALASPLGWLPRRRPSGVSMRVVEAVLEAPSTTGVLLAMRWHRFAAVLGDEPEERLRDIDALLRMQSPAGAMMEGLLGVWSRYQRDRLHLELALQGRLPADRESRFVAEDPDDLRLLADACRAEAMLFAGLLAEDILAGRHRASRLLDSSIGVGDRTRFAAVWFWGPSTAAEALEVVRSAERTVRGEPGGQSIPELARRLDDSGRFIGVPYPVLDTAARFHCMGRARGRAARLAVRLVTLRRERGRLPADEAEARAWLGPSAAAFDPGERDLRLRYERPRDDILRIAVDPASAPPLLIAGWGDSPPEWMLGTPPASRPLTFRQEGLEIRFPR